MQTLLKQSIIGGLSFLLLTGIAFSVGSSEPSVFEGEASSTNVIIADVYTSGGSSGATEPLSSWTRDYVLLFNLSSSATSIAGWSLQYASSTGTFSVASTTEFIFPANTSIAAKSYLLILCGSAGATGSVLPTGDFDTLTDLSLSATSGKLALANNNQPVTFTGTPGTNQTFSSNLVDLVGWGTANAYEGSSAVTAPARNQTMIRKRPFKDNDQNASDFQLVSTYTPYNSSTDISTFTSNASGFASTFISTTDNKFNLCTTEGLSWASLKSSYDALSYGAQNEFGNNSVNGTILNARDRYTYLRSFDNTLLNFANI